MTNENFDNFIKKQLESLKPPFEEAAWTRLKRHLPIPWYLNLFQNYGGWLLGGLSSIALLTSLFFNYRTNQTNQKLNEEIATLKNLKPNIEEPTGGVPQTAFTEKLRVDTVVVYKTIIVEKPVYVYSDSEKNLDSNTSENLDSKINSDSDSKKNLGSNAELESKIISNSEPNHSNKITEKADSEKLLPETRIVKGDERELKDPPKLEKEKAEEVNKTPDTYSELKLPAKTDEVKKPKKQFKLPKIDSRIGLQTDFGGFGRDISSGINLEVFLNNRISLQSGISIYRPDEMEHKSQKDFNSATGKRFEDVYRKSLPKDFDKIEDIKVRTSTIQLPLSINYYIPLKSNFSFMVLAGTKLNLSSYMNLRYESYFNGEEQYNSIEDKSDLPTFTGIFYGAGLQYQRKRFVFQAIPNFEFKFRENNFPRRNNEFGLNTSFKYQFGK